MDADFLLIRKMRQGDDQAFDTFVRKYYDDIFTYCARHCSDLKYAEDLTQDTFVRFITGLSDYRHAGKAKNYLYTVVGNLCKNYYRKLREIPFGEFPPEEGIYAGNGYGQAASDSPEEEVTDRLMIEQALAKLPGEFEEMIRMYYFRELKMTEIAESLGIGIPLVKYRLRRGKEMLREILEKEEDICENRETRREKQVRER